MAEPPKVQKVKGICFEYQCIPLGKVGAAEEALYASCDRSGDGFVHVSSRTAGLLENVFTTKCTERSFRNELDLPSSLDVDLTLDDSTELARLRTLLGYEVFVDAVSGVQFHLYTLPKPAALPLDAEKIAENLPPLLERLREHGLFRRPLHRHMTLLVAERSPTMQAREVSAYVGGCSEHPVIVMGYDSVQNHSTTRHEFAHAWRLFSQAGIASWLDEGLAERAEDDPSLSPKHIANSLLPLSLEEDWEHPQIAHLSWKDGNPEELKHRQQSYAISHAFMLYLDDRDSAWDERFHEELARSGDAEETFTVAAGTTLNVLQMGFWAWLRERMDEREHYYATTVPTVSRFSTRHCEPY